MPRTALTVEWTRLALTIDYHHVCLPQMLRTGIGSGRVTDLDLIRALRLRAAPSVFHDLPAFLTPVAKRLLRSNDTGDN